MKDELGGKIMKGLFRLREKTYSYLKDNNDEDKKGKGKKSVYHLKKPLNFNIIKATEKQFKWGEK